MGLTLIAIFTAALLLPGIFAARAFYRAGQIREIEVPIPSLSTPEGVSLVGGFSVVVHAAYALALRAVTGLPPLIPLPPANPYLLFGAAPSGSALDVAWALFSGLLLLGVFAIGIGYVTGFFARKWLGRAWFYGPLAEVIKKADGADRFISAYVLTRIEKDGRFVGYQGTVNALFRDADRFPVKVVLKDVVPFHLDVAGDTHHREETDQLIDWLVLTDWHNIAFRVFRFADE